MEHGYAVTYEPGDALLVGSGACWLLVGDADLDDDGARRLFDAVRDSPGDTRPVLAAIDVVCGPKVSYVLVDLTPGRESTLTQGSGRLSTRDGVHVLALDPDAGPSSGRPLAGGVVAASAARVRVTAPSAPVPEGLIDGIPADVLATRAPSRAPGSLPSIATADPPLPGRPPSSTSGSTVRRTPSADPDHDGHTTYRPELAVEATAPAVDHLRQTTRETVLAVHCPAGHVTAAFSPRCRVCHEPVSDQEPRRVPRPTLGVLHLPDGERVSLDRGVVFGRQPSAPPRPSTGSDGGDRNEWPQLVRLPSESTFVSRSHLLVELDGWLVLATDLGSRGGTTLRVPGRAPERIRAHERYVWEPGQVLDLADSYEVVYEVTG